jgi:hypothetical protein
MNEAKGRAVAQGVDLELQTIPKPGPQASAETADERDARMIDDRSVLVVPAER